MSKRMTKAQTAQYEKLCEKLKSARDVVYSFGPNHETPFSECYKLLTPANKKAYDDAWLAVMNFEGEMIGQGRAWRHGVLGFRSY